MIVIYERGRWTVTAPGAGWPVDTDLAGVLDHAAPDASAPAAPLLDAACVVRPLGPLVLVDEGAGLAIAPAHRAEPARLGRVAVRLLDAMVDPCTLQHLADTLDLPIDTVSAEVQNLIALGAVTEHPAVDAEVLVPRPVSPAYHVTPVQMGTTEAGPPLGGDRIPVVAVWPIGVGPPLGLGMLLASARAWEGGRLTASYDFRPPMPHDRLRELLAEYDGPLVLLCSNYVWSTGENLAFADEVRARHPHALIIHGGPNTPAIVHETEQFFREHSADVAVRGEAEHTLAEVLSALEGRWPDVDLAALEPVAGLSYRSRATGVVVRTPDRERLSDLGVLPSAYLSGVLDDTDPGYWDVTCGIIPVETNRGCPYGCTFCDWGSATNSRIRQFPMERVLAEIEWLAERKLDVWFITDANFGMMPRDVEIARTIADIRERTGHPHLLSFTPTKNGVRNLGRIFDLLCQAEIATLGMVSFQTRNEAILEAIERRNIRLERYDQLAAEFRRLGLPIASDMVLGLPGATMDTLADDIQYCIDEQIQPRLWVLQMLPNAPMNDPAYRAKHAIVVDDEGKVISTSSYTVEDFGQMMRLRRVERAFEHMGLVRHVLRYLQWDHGIRAVDTLRRIATVTEERPADYPLLAWVVDYFEVFQVPPFNWRRFYAEVERFVARELGVPGSSGLRAVLDVQCFVMPDRGRTYPASITLDHDYVSYFRHATDHLLLGTPAPDALHALESFGPAVFTVFGDPARLGDSFRRLGEDRGSDLLANEYWQISHLELDSPLARVTAETRATSGYSFDADRPEPPDVGEDASLTPSVVSGLQVTRRS